MKIKVFLTEYKNKEKERNKIAFYEVEMSWEEIDLLKNNEKKLIKSARIESAENITIKKLSGSDYISFQFFKHDEKIRTLTLETTLNPHPDF